MRAPRTTRSGLASRSMIPSFAAPSAAGKFPLRPTSADVGRWDIDCNSVMLRRRSRILALGLAVSLGACVSGSRPGGEALLRPESPEVNRRAPDGFRVRLETSRGLILLEIHRD